MQAMSLVFTVFFTTLAFVMSSLVGNEAQAEPLQRGYETFEPASTEYGPFYCQLPADGDLRICADGIEVPYGSGVSVNLFSAESAGQPQPVQFIANDANKNNNFGYYYFGANEARGVYQFLGEHFPREGSFDPAALRLYAGAEGGQATQVTFFVKVFN